MLIQLLVKKKLMSCLLFNKIKTIRIIKRLIIFRFGYLKQLLIFYKNN